MRNKIRLTNYESAKILTVTYSDPSKPTTKICEKCGCKEMIPMRGTDTKLCSNGGCLNEIPWPLDKGQSKVL